MSKAGRDMVIFVVCRAHFGYKGESKIKDMGVAGSNFPVDLSQGERRGVESDKKR